MEALINILGLITVVGSGIVAGGQVFCLRAVLPALGEFPPETSAKIHQDALSERPHRYLRPVSIVSLFSAVALLVLLVIEDDRAAAIALLGAGVVVLVVSGVMSSREWPINHEIDGWGTAPVLDRYAVLRAKWDQQHRVRTLLSVVALLLLVLATVTSREL